MNKFFELRSDFFDPQLICLSGQAFRFKNTDSEHTELVAFGKYLQIAKTSKDRYLLSCSKEEYEHIWKDYFDMDLDYRKIYESIDPEDSYLKKAADFGYGIRILKQDIWETYISYIISQRRSIPSITTSVNRLSEICGRKITLPKLPEPFIKPSAKEYYSFPDPKAVAALTLKQIEKTGVGYRAQYIYEAAQKFACGELDPEKLKQLDDSSLYDLLLSQFGIGKKVANCIMLFAFHRLGRFPIDVWMERIVNAYYNGEFDVGRYPDTAGIMQQFMFYYERNR